MRARGMAATLMCVLSTLLASFIADEPLLADRDARGAPQELSTGDAPQGERFTWIFQQDAKILQGQLDDLAARGYRMVFGSVYGGLFERRPKDEGVRYVVLRNQRIAALQAEVNRAISQGHRVTLRGVDYWPLTRAAGVLEITGRAIPQSIESPAVDASGYTYQGIGGVDHELKRVTRRVKGRFRVVAMELAASENSESLSMLVEQTIGDDAGTPGGALAPVQLKWIAPRWKSMERELNKLGSQGYQLRLVGTRDGYASWEPLLLEKSADAAERPEYKAVTSVNSTPERVLIALNEAGARGFRLHSSLDGTRLIMEKVATAQVADYLFFADLASLNAAAAQGTIEGFSVFGLIRFRKTREPLFILERLQKS